MKIDSYSTPERKLVTAEEIYQHVKRYCLHSALAQLGQLGMKIFKKDPSLANLVPSTINEFQLAFLAKALILNANDHKRERFEYKGLMNSVNLFNNLHDPLLEVPDDADGDEHKRALNSFLVRMANQQFPLQGGVRHLVPRALFLFDEIPQSIKNPKIDIQKEIKEIYGLTTKEVIIVGFAIWAKSGEGYFKPDSLINTDSENLKKYLNEKSVNQMLSTMTANYRKLREVYEAEEQPGFEQYSFNALRQYPVVETQIAGYVIPVQRFVLEKISNGIFYTLSEKYKKDNSNMFLEFFGKELFEEYVRMLFVYHYGEANIIREFEYKKGKRKLWSPDLILLEGNEAILVECKTSGITKESKTLGDKDRLIEDLRKRVVKAVTQTETFVQDIRSKSINDERLEKVKKFHHVVVTYDRIYMSGTPPIKDLINLELSKSGIEGINYQVLGIDEVEMLIPLLNHYSFSVLLNEKETNKDWASEDFDSFIYHFLKEKGKELGENVMLKEKLDSLMREISPKMGLKKSKSSD